MAGKTLVYATHDLEMALGHAGRLWVIDGDRVVEGGPEDLGLSGLFDRLFRDEGIGFDPGVLRFTTRDRWKGTAGISGGDLRARIWTGNALKRAGFLTTEETGVPDPGLPRLMIGISGEFPGYRWILQKGGRDYFFERLYSLVQFLTREE
jgi:energy-coupling factor transporter ATP-binding protein EcfA2